MAPLACIISPGSMGPAVTRHLASYTAAAWRCPGWHPALTGAPCRALRFFSHPLAQYVDLLFLANCSCIILDDNTSGYYLHGRNQVQHSDTDMAELNQGLLLEERGLVANRGLVTCYQDDPQLNDVQTFAIHVPEELRQRWAPPLMLLAMALLASARCRSRCMGSRWMVATIRLCCIKMPPCSC